LTKVFLPPSRRHGSYPRREKSRGWSLSEFEYEDGVAVEFERVLNSVSKNDIKDFMALHGVGSLGRQIEVGIKRTTAEVAQGLLAGLLMVLLLFFGIVLLGLLASLVH
jgi:hypothetical protein